MADGDMMLNLLDSVRLPEENICWIDSWWQAEVPGIITALSGNEIRNDLPYEFQMDAVGRKLVFILQVLSQFANNLINGPYIDGYTDRIISELVDEDDGSLLDYIESKGTALRVITQNLIRVSAECTEVWQQTQNLDLPSILPGEVWPPNAKTQPSTVSSVVDRRSFDPAMSVSGSVGADANHSDILDSPNQDEYGYDAVEVPPLDHLKSRGKGSYSCPHGMSCKKGGVENGQVKIFTRNSHFRAHLLKHEKTYKCDLPGCPNQKGFSRLDQLERHKRLVKHEESVWREVNPGQRS